MSRFDSAIATAVRLIAKNGMKVTWVVNRDETPETDKPWEPTETKDCDKKYPTICFVPVNKVNREFISFMTGRNDVVQGAVVGLMAGNVSFKPDQKDYVIRGCEKLKILNFELIAPNEQKVLYIIEFQS